MYTMSLTQGTVTRTADGVVIAPCQSDNDPDFLDYLGWVHEGNQPEVVEPEVDPVHDLNLYWLAIKSERDRLSEQGGYKVSVGGAAKWFHSDAKSKTQQLSLVIMGANVPPVPWKTMDGSKVTMTQALAGQIFQAAAAQDMALFAAAEAHKAAMEASPIPADYDFSGGWPAVYSA